MIISDHSDMIIYDQNWIRSAVSMKIYDHSDMIIYDHYWIRSAVSMKIYDHFLYDHL